MNPKLHYGYYDRNEDEKKAEFAKLGCQLMFAKGQRNKALVRDIEKQMAKLQ